MRDGSWSRSPNGGVAMGVTPCLQAEDLLISGKHSRPPMVLTYAYSSPKPRGGVLSASRKTTKQLLVETRSSASCFSERHRASFCRHRQRHHPSALLFASIVSSPVKTSAFSSSFEAACSSLRPCLPRSPRHLPRGSLLCHQQYRET